MSKEAANNKFNWRQHESKRFDELLLIEIKITITKLFEKVDGLLRKIIDRADEHDR